MSAEEKVVIGGGGAVCAEVTRQPAGITHAPVGTTLRCPWQPQAPPRARLPGAGPATEEY